MTNVDNEVCTSDLFWSSGEARFGCKTGWLPVNSDRNENHVIVGVATEALTAAASVLGAAFS